MNPQVQAVVVAVLGDVAWKALDVQESYLQKEIATKDRTAEQRELDSQAEDKRVLDCQSAISIVRLSSKKIRG